MSLLEEESTNTWSVPTSLSRSNRLVLYLHIVQRSTPTSCNGQRPHRATANAHEVVTREHTVWTANVRNACVAVCRTRSAPLPTPSTRAPERNRTTHPLTHAHTRHQRGWLRGETGASPPSAHRLARPAQGCLHTGADRVRVSLAHTRGLAVRVSARLGLRARVLTVCMSARPGLRARVLTVCMSARLGLRVPDETRVGAARPGPQVPDGARQPWNEHEVWGRVLGCVGFTARAESHMGRTCGEPNKPAPVWPPSALC